MELNGWLNGLSADALVVLLTLGVALIYYELNRPGSVLPGAVGLLMVLLGLSAEVRRGVDNIGVTLILSAGVLLAVSLVRPTSMHLSTLFCMVATVALVLGLRWLPGSGTGQRVHMPVAVGCGLTLGAGTSLLTRIARRARINKGLDKKGLDYWKT